MGYTAAWEFIVLVISIQARSDDGCALSRL